MLALLKVTWNEGRLEISIQNLLRSHQFCYSKFQTHQWANGMNQICVIAQRAEELRKGVNFFRSKTRTKTAKLNNPLPSHYVIARLKWRDWPRTHALLVTFALEDLLPNLKTVRAVILQWKEKGILLNGPSKLSRTVPGTWRRKIWQHPGNPKHVVC